MSDSLPPGPSDTPAPAAPAESAPAAPAAPSFTPHTETPSILGAAVAPALDIEAPRPADGALPASTSQEPEAPKPGEAPVVTEAEKVEPPKPGEEPKVEAPTIDHETLEPITYPEWTLPEGVQPDKEALAQFNELLGQHRLPPEIGQALLDRHTAAMQQFAQHTLAEQHRAFGEMRADWRTQTMADPVIGGSRHQTAMGAIARFRDRFVSDHAPNTPEFNADVKAFNEMLIVTGVGDHPVLNRVLHRAAQFVDEPRLPPVNNGPAPNGGMPRKKGMAGIYKQPPGGR